MSAAPIRRGVPEFEPATNAAPSLGDFLDQQVRPRLTAEMVFDHPVHNWRRSPGKWRGACPWHTSASGSSFNVSLDDLSWYCPACDVGGGPIQYLYRLQGGTGTPRGRDFVDIAGGLAQRVGLALPERELTAAERKAAEARAVKRGALEAVYRVCQDYLWSDEGIAARSYLYERGLDDEAIHDQQLGLYPPLAELRKALRAAGYTGGAAVGLWDQMVGYVTVPWRDEYGQPMTLYGRRPGVAPAGDDRAKTLALPGQGSKASPLFFDRVRRKHLRQVVMVEGLLDAMVAQALGDDRVVAYVAGQPPIPHHALLARHGITTAIICSDPDKGGEGGIKSFLRHTDAAVRPYVAPTLRDGMDPDEFMLADGIEAWREHIAQAEPGHVWTTRYYLGRYDLSSAIGRDGARGDLIGFASTLQAHQLDDVVRVASGPLQMETGTLRRLLDSQTGRRTIDMAADAAREAVVPSPEPTPIRPTRARVVTLPTSPSLNKISRPGRRPQTDMGNAERLVDQHGDNLRYCSAFSSYLVWDGRHWCMDQAGTAVTLAMRAVRDIYVEASKAETPDERKLISDWARKSEAAARIASMLQLAQPLVPIGTGDLDRDPWLLNVRNGTVDLRDGTLRPHRHEDFITKLIDVEYQSDAPCQRWERFLEEIQPKASTRRFLQRAAGYSATGSARERVLIILHGGGRNGKSVLLQELRTTLGPYAVRMPSETFLAKRQDGAIPNDIAQLRGARFAFGSETGEGRRLAEAKIKEMTGDESITARFMRGEWFDFRPTFTPWLATNHRPVIKGSDAAIWDRIRLVPFSVRFRLPDEPETELRVADLSLSEKLDGERSGILDWIVRGAVEWYREGLGTPEEVRSATTGYQASMDDLADFLADRCVAEAGTMVGSRALYEAYKNWSEASGERPLAEKLFSARVEDRGFTKTRRTAGVIFSGVRLRTPIDDEAPCEDASRVGATGANARNVGFGRMQGPGPFSGMTGRFRESRGDIPENPTQPYIVGNPTSHGAEGRSCWQCSQWLSGDTDEECAECGWFRCSACGACGCREDDDA